MDFGRSLEQWTVSTFFPPLWNALTAEKEQRNTAETDFVKEVIVGSAMKEMVANLMQVFYMGHQYGYSLEVAESKIQSYR